MRAVLSPDDRSATQRGHGGSIDSNLGQFCTGAPHSDEPHAVNVDGSNDQLLLRGRKGDGECASTYSYRARSDAPVFAGMTTMWDQDHAPADLSSRCVH